MKRIISSVLVLCCAVGLVWAQEPECPENATATSTISFRRNNSSILPGAFSVSAEQQVNFTRGNLQYNAAYNSWRFAENQYTYIGNVPGNSVATIARATQNEWIDMFGWATSGYNSTSVDATAEHYQPWSYVQASTGDANNAYHYGPSITIMPAESSWSGSLATQNFDWGVYNFTAGVEAGCRTLTKNEWAFLLTDRCDNTGAALCGHGNLFGVNGLFLLPDAWSWSSSAVAAAVTAASFVWKSSDEAQLYTNNVIADDDNGRALWRAMEDAGAVFLPAAGWRTGGDYQYAGEHAGYASSTARSEIYSYGLMFYENRLTALSYFYRSTEIPVRLVKNVAP